MESTRQQKISKLLQKDLGDIFQKDIQEIVGSYVMVTVTKVTVTKDLAESRVFLSIFATPDKEAVFKTIVAQTRLIRMKLSQRVRHQLRVIPQLIFKFDDSLDYIEHIDELLKD